MEIFHKKWKKEQRNSINQKKLTFLDLKWTRNGQFLDMEKEQ